MVDDKDGPGSIIFTEECYVDILRGSMMGWRNTRRAETGQVLTGSRCLGFGPGLVRFRHGNTKDKAEF